jgi:hypothetical protein
MLPPVVHCFVVHRFSDALLTDGSTAASAAAVGSVGQVYNLLIVANHAGAPLA